MPTRVPRRAFAGLFAAAAIVRCAKAADVAPTKDAPDLRKVRTMIDAKNYTAALAELNSMMASANNQHPDVYSLTGFALRKSGDSAKAMTYYAKALDADPTHRGALEYQGELFVETGQIDKAKVNLAKLDRLCLFGCEEQADLKKAIEHTQTKK